MGDLFSGEAAERAQRQRDLSFDRERGMAAGEDEPEPVVDDGRHVVVLVADEQFLRGRLLVAALRFATKPIDRLPSGRREQPGPWSIGHAVERPALERDDDRLLQRVFGGVEVAEVSNE